MKYQITQDLQNNYKTRRTRDEKDEKIVGDFLDKYFYPTFSNTITRNTDRDTQINGLDVTVDGFNDVKYTIDEKAATRWIGRNLQTFAHEISGVNVNGDTYNGWLLDFNSASDYLVEVWIDNVNSTDGYLHDYTNITDTTIAMIKKSDLYQWLKSKNIKSTELLAIGETLRENGEKSQMYKGYKVICQQPPIQERAANILIPRSTLINTIASYAVQVKNNKVITLRKK